MSGLELNKIIAAILLASLIAMLVGTVANILYKPNLTASTKGYQVEVTEDTSSPDGDQKQTVDIEKLMASANAENGKNIAKKCVSCHTFEQGGAAKVGPNLFNVVNAPKAHIDGFPYSKAMLSAGGTWDVDSLYHFFNKPGKFIPGTKMSFAGLAKPEDIADVIAYLKTNGNQ